VAFTGAVGLGGAQRTVTTVADTTFSGGVSGGGLIKAGPAALVVGGTGGFSGTVAVDAGTLSVGPSGVLSTAQVSVAPGATLSVLGLVQTFGGSVTVDGTLSGMGTIEGDTTIRGIHSPGTTAPGAGTFLGDLFYQQAGIAVPRVDWRLNANTSVFQAGTTYDKLVVQNDLAFQSNTTMNLAFDRQGSTVSWADPFWAQDRTFTVYEVGGATSGAARLQLDPSQSYQDSTNQPLNAVRPDARFGIRQDGQNVTVVYYATPEPSTWAMAAGAAGIAALAGCRRRAGHRRPPCRR
jgi:autotransporter-associated beta strand protein